MVRDALLTMRPVESALYQRGLSSGAACGPVPGGAAGFATTLLPLTQRGEIGREEALERIHGRFISTLRLLDEAEFEEGLARAERELPDRIPYELEWAVALASRA